MRRISPVPTRGRGEEAEAEVDDGAMCSNFTLEEELAPAATEAVVAEPLLLLVPAALPRPPLPGVDRHDDDDDDAADGAEEVAEAGAEGELVMLGCDCDGAMSGGRDVTSPVALVTVRLASNTGRGGEGAATDTAGAFTATGVADAGAVLAWADGCCGEAEETGTGAASEGEGDSEGCGGCAEVGAVWTGETAGWATAAC
jgi:hypothetical protein